jgi:hypothetical protein
MSVQLSTGLRNGMLNATGMYTAFTNGVMYIYSGPQPLTADAAVQGTLLGIVTKNAAAFVFGTSTNGLNLTNTPAAGVATKDTNAWQVGNGAGVTGWSAAGIAGWFRLMGNASDNLGSSTTLARMDGAIAQTGGDLNLSSVNTVVAAPATIDVFQFTLPAS